MRQTHSDDLDIKTAAAQAADIVRQTLDGLPWAEVFEYGGHDMRLDQYDMCRDCTSPIAQAQQAAEKLTDRANSIQDDVVKEHVEQAAQLLRYEAEAAEVRAKLHSGRGSEPIVNELLGFVYHRNIHDRPEHSHAGKAA